MVVSACLRLLLLSACLRAGRLEKADALEAHDILDLGASKNAHSAVFFEALQGQLPAGGRALRMATLDSNPEKVASCNATARSEQHTCLTADVTSLARSSPPLVTGALLFHVLEHITSVKRRRDLMVIAQKQNATLATVVLRSAAALSSTFVYVRGLSFDDASDLRKLGLTRYYETWAANTCHFNSTHLMRVFRDLSRLRDAHWAVVLGQPLPNSQHDALVPLGMPVDSFPYSSERNSATRLPKPRGFNFMKIPFYGTMFGLLVFDDAPYAVDGLPTSELVNAVVHDLLIKTKDGRRVLHCSHGWDKCDRIRSVKDKRKPFTERAIAAM